VIRVAAITSGKNDPSSRFRMRQFFAPLRKFDVAAVEYAPWISKYAPAAAQLTGLGAVSRVVAAVASRPYDIVWLNRELVCGRETIERLMGRCRLFDVDDAIWLSGRPGFALKIAARAHGVIAGNARIADYFRQAALRVWIVPTAVDTDAWIPAPTARDTFIVGWSGTHWNLPYLYAIEEALAGFLARHPDARLAVVCDRRPSFRRVPCERIDFTQWSPSTEVAAVQRMDVGLMPLPDTEWTRAKCSMKMLCYMSVGLPVVVSPVGTAAEILQRGGAGIAARDHDEWRGALEQLYFDRQRGFQMGQDGRRIAVEHYSVGVVVGQLAAIFAAASQR
jgi:glycosyltransferase involved in cell wall biosynthesis